MLIDELRAGGEPVIAQAHDGSIVISSHPGWTHYHPSSDQTHAGTELVEPASAQSYLWRSTDGGKSWTHIGLPGADGAGPRGTAPGVSDPEFTVRADGVIFHTDLEALAMSSVSWSKDNGATWTEGNPIAAGGPNDRQWLASFGPYVYFTANYFVDHHIQRSTDGLTWERLGNIPPSCSDLISASDGTLIAACGSGIAVSEDGGFSWQRRLVPEDESTGVLRGGGIAEPGLDSSGNVWVAWEVNETSLFIAGTPDKGLSWPWIRNITGSVKAALGSDTVRMVWPWISAGSTGRVAVTLYATPTADPSASGSIDREWSVVTVAALSATSPAIPTAYVVKKGHHVGPICQSGTACQVSSVQGDPNSDRRLGDFFETTIDREGFLHVAYSDTHTKATDVISHVGYVRQTGGPRFVVDGYVPTQG
jgi:hypothetical protein